MKAIVQDEYGGADRVLRLEDIDRPAVGDDEVLLRVHAAGLDRGAWHLMAGLPYPVRLAGYGLRAPRDRVRGRELAGRVEQVGRNVTTLQPGDEVLGVAEGCFAEYAVGRADRLVPRPAELSVVQAAAVPISGLTALQAVRDQGGVRAGQRVLVIGASGGIGTFAVQLAKAAGAAVTGVCRTSKVDLVSSIGADRVIDYTSADLAGQHYDVVLDIGGNRPLGQLRRLLTPHGTLVIVGGENGGKWLGGTDRQLRAALLSPFVGQRLRTFIASENGADLRVLTEHITAGAVTPIVDRTFALPDTAAAIQYLLDGRARGKVVVTVDSP